MATLKQKEAVAAYGFLIPAYAIYILFLALPLVAALMLSVLEVDRLTLKAEWVGWANFDWIFTDPRFWQTFANTFYFIVLAVAGNVGLGLVLAVLLDRRLPGPLLYLFRLAYFLPVLVSLAFVSFIWQFLFSYDLGAINYYVKAMGLPPVRWLTDKNIAMLSIIIIDVWKNVGFFLIVFLAALQGVPKTLLEAARIDGASHAQIYLTIVLPLAKPALGALAIFTFVAQWNNFLWPLITTTKPDMQVAIVALATLQGQYNTDWPLLMTGSVIAIVPVLLVFVFGNRAFIAGLTTGAFGGR